MENIVDKIHQATEERREEFTELSHFIYANPELGDEEYKSSQAHVEYLEKHGFDIEKPYLGMETAFRASYESGKPGPSICFLSEYDALPGIGHGCGHNILGAVETTAGIVLRYFLDEYGGRVVVLGTPAEETNGAKVVMADQGAFDDIDVALATHPNDTWEASSTSMALEPLAFEFFGKTSHASETPHLGVNALDAAVSFYVNLSMLRQQIEVKNKVHAIIKEGGLAANIIPDYTKVECYVRSMTMPELKELREKVIACAEGAAKATGCRMEYHNYEYVFENLITNQSLSELFNKNMDNLGVHLPPAQEGELGSLDMGNVSQVVPAINAYYSISGNRPVPGHTVEFRECSITKEGEDAGLLTVEGLVKTSLDLIQNPKLLEEIQEEFENTVGRLEK